MRLFLLSAGLLMLAACGGQDAPPAAPTGLTVVPGDRSVQVQWAANGESDLKGYVVAVTLEGGAVVSNNPVAAPATSLIVTDLTNGTVYTFRVLAEDKAGNRSAPSAPVVATPGSSTPPAKPSGLSAAAQTEQVLLSWSKNPEPDLKGYMIFYGTSAGNLAQTKAVPAAAVSTVVGGLTNGTPYFFALEAENNAGQKSPRSEVVSATPLGSLSAPVIGSFSLTGYGNSTQVRQGAGGIEVTLQGERLDTLTSARLVGAFDFTVAEKTPTTAKLTAIVPHGLEVGPRTLLVAGTGGETAFADALEVTKITAAKTPQLNPSDSTGRGTPNRPFLTLTRALAAAGSGDTILLGAGTYSAGETWPQSSTGSLALPAPNILANLTIEGQSSDRGAVILQGAGKLAGSSALIFAGSATVRNLTLRDFRFALALNAGTASSRVGELTLENLSVFDNLAGLTVNFAQRASLSRVSLNNNTNGGLSATAVGNLEIRQGSEFNGNTYGIAAGNASVGGTLLVSRITLDGVTASQNTQFGMSLGDLSIDLSNTAARLNTSYGLRLLGKPSFVALRAGTTLEQNGDFQLFDARDASQGTFTATRFLLPGSGVTVGAVVGPTQSGNFYRITNSGNAILFQ